MILSLALAVWSDPAAAAGFQTKTMRAPLSAVEVERPLVIGRGWMEFGLGADAKLATGQWSDAGEVEAWDSASWLYTTERFDLRYGIARRAELYASVPFHYVRLQNEKLGTDTTTSGIGDPRFGWKLEWLRTADSGQVPTSSVVTDLGFRVPAGSESPGNFIGGPTTVDTFVLSTGTMDADLTVRGRKRVGPVALTGELGYARRFAGVTQYVIESENLQFAGRFKPGDEIHASITPMVQLGPVAVQAEAAYRHRAAASVGTTSGGLFKDRYLDAVPGSDGDMFDVRPGFTLNATRQLDVRGSVGIPLLGEDLAFFPLESISPTYGLTYSGTVAFRY